MAEMVPESALRLRYTTQRITPEEFRWQESHYDHDSRRGRELLFLIANDEWIRVTSEIIDVSQSDAVDTTIKVDIDLDQITHEAFRDRIGRFWLPVILLPPEIADRQQPPHQQSPEPDPFATIIDATGGLLPLLPTADIRHQISAAMAEIIVNMAVARWSGGDKQPVAATRDQRLVLSAAIYRLLRGRVTGGFYASPPSLEFGTVTADMEIRRTVHIVNDDTAEQKVSGVTHPADQSFIVTGLSKDDVVHPGKSLTATVTYAPTELRSASSAFTIGFPNHKVTVNLSATAEDHPLPRLDQAKKDLDKLFSPFIDIARTSADGNDDTVGPESSPRPERKQEADRSALELTRRAVRVLEAFAESVVVVVPVDRRSTPTALTVRVPAREMTHEPSRGIQQPQGKGAFAWIKRRLADLTWILRPLGHLQIDMLLPSADADRRVQINLPDGVSLRETGIPCCSMEIQVEPPQPLNQLRVLIGQLIDPKTNRREFVQQCLADLARTKAVAIRETLRLHDAYPSAERADARAGAPVVPTTGDTPAEATTAGALAQPTTADAPAEHTTGAASAEPTEADARSRLDELIVDLNKLSDGQPIDPVETGLAEKWKAFDSLTGTLLRRTFAAKASPHTIMARADMIEDVSQRASPTSAKIDVNVEISDAEYFSIARFSGWMSLLIMILVLIFFPVAHFLGYDTSHPAAEVLAIVLTLFSAHQATRIERPDRSTLYGLLSVYGNWLIVASIMPTVTLAVVLAFSPSWVWTILWAGFCIGLQLLLQVLMWRGPLSTIGPRGLAQPWEFHTKEADYRHSDTLRSDWWRSTTADALMIGRKAYAYVAWHKDPSVTLMTLLKRTQRLTRLGGTANVLALLRSGTADQALTFVVFREEPPQEWADGACQYEFDPDRLAPLEQATSIVDVFLGTPRECGLHVLANHPLMDILRAAETHRLIVLEIQLPMPAPVAVFPPCHWTRIRVALRDADTSRLAPFLADIRADTADKDGKSTKLIVAVQVVPSDGPRMITGSAKDGNSLPVVASDMDVLTLAADKDESPNACNWRVLAICADARSGIEYEIMKKLGGKRKQLQLAGLTYGLLHGTAVVLLLGHEPGSDHVQNSDPYLERDLIEEDGSLAKLHVLVNGWQSREQLGHVNKDPLLQVWLRAPDRPGALVDVLGSLNRALDDKLPNVDQNVWHAYIRVTGHAAFTRLTVRLDTTAPTVMDWYKKGLFDEIQRKVRRLVARDAAAARSAESHPDYELDPPEDPVINVDLIIAPSVQ